ncbi:MAG: hypothetical protein KDE09_03805 [Anaerolineales bacterium]|nr:hypothetical protein [Anaerolineales bacterium]MCB0005136.1 hypothetical protein [Anaerolineales bacterium]MCB0016888.1 hypothetical protein [Anaerolineales bacterium]MCB8961114.1 hypothetical protein [Ardenticatenales bacterium]
MTPVRVIPIHDESPFLGEECALCRSAFMPGDEVIVCPECRARHHVHCWTAFDNRCTAFGCAGRGEISRTPPAPQNITIPIGRESSRVRTLPSISIGNAQGCLVVAIALSIVLFAIGCFGLWAIADYIMLEILDWDYRTPLEGLLPTIQAIALLVG